MSDQITMTDICRIIGHRWDRVGQHEVGGVPSHYQHDMAAVPRGSVIYTDYKCRRCGGRTSDAETYSWRMTTVAS